MVFCSVLAVSLLSALLASGGWWYWRSRATTVLPNGSGPSACSPSDPSQAPSSDCCGNATPHLLRLPTIASRSRFLEVWPFLLGAVSLGLLASSLTLTVLVIPNATRATDDLRRERQLLIDTQRERVANDAHILFLQQQSLGAARQLAEQLRAIREVADGD